MLVFPHAGSDARPGAVRADRSRWLWASGGPDPGWSAAYGERVPGSALRGAAVGELGALSLHFRRSEHV